MAKLSHKERLVGVNEDLVAALELAAASLKFDLLVVCGRRTEAEQEILYKKKLSKVHGPNAPHCLGNAVDVCPLIDGKCVWDCPKNFDLIRTELEKYIKLTPYIIWDKNHYQIIP